jgi:hypothetical protein
LSTVRIILDTFPIVLPTYSGAIIEWNLLNALHLPIPFSLLRREEYYGYDS